MRFLAKLGAASALAIGMAMTGAAYAQDYPTREIQGTIQWGAGGATDVMSRRVTPMVEEILGQRIVLTNRTGGAGAIAIAYMTQRPANGYELLYAAENGLLHRSLGLSQIDFVEQFYPINILAQGYATIVVNADSPWQTMEDLLADIAARPGEIRMGGTGPGGQPHVVSQLLAAVTDFDINAVPFDGEGPAVTALQGGHVDFVPSGISAVAEQIRAGRLRALATNTLERVNLLPDTPAITEVLPEMERFLPWGSFYGIWVHKDTPDDIKAKLVEAFGEAAGSDEFQEFAINFGSIPLNIHGEEATEFLTRWRSVTTWVLDDAGETAVSPADLGIERIN